MSNTRYNLLAVLLLVVGAASTLAGIMTILRGQSIGVLLVILGALLLFFGLLLILILVNDPVRKGKLSPTGPTFGTDTTKVSNPRGVRFTVGEHEKHEVVYRWDQTWGWSTVTVDDTLVAKHLTTMSLRLVQTISFEVGQTERHAVRIEKQRSLLFSFARYQPISAFVDDVLVAEAA